MDTKKILLRIKKINEQLRYLHDQSMELKVQCRKLERDYSNNIGEKYTGLKVGDRINFTRNIWVQKSENITMQVTGFEAYIRGDGEDNVHPTITGILVLKSGELGLKRESIYYHENITWKRLTPALSGDNIRE